MCDADGSALAVVRDMLDAAYIDELVKEEYRIQKRQDPYHCQHCRLHTGCSDT
jgi:hypothetical protein